MAEFLAIKAATDKFDKGDLLGVVANSHSYGAGDLNNRVLIKSPSILLSTARNYVDRLLHRFLIDTVSSDLVTDTHRLKIYSEYALNPGSVNVAKIMDILSTWDASGFAVVGQSLKFDLNVLDAAKSLGFWGISTGSVSFTDSYDQPSGIHTITADYSATSKNATGVEILVDEQGLTITHHLNRIITYEVHRSQVAAALKEAIDRRGCSVQAYKRFKFKEAVINAAIAAGDEVTLTPAQLQNNLIDKTTL